MDQKHLEANLGNIYRLLSHLHGEVTKLETQYSEVLLVLRKEKGLPEEDELTGLRRRTTFFRQWKELLTECNRLKQNSGLLLIDVDHLSKVNQTHGQATGDEVLKRIATLLKKYESPNFISGRFGGEEFAVAVRGSDIEILGVAEFIRRGAERLYGPVIEPNGKASVQVTWKCTLSVGMASTQDCGKNATRLLESAYKALYRAKKSGRNQVRSVA